MQYKIKKLSELKLGTDERSVQLLGFGHEKEIYSETVAFLISFLSK